MSPRPGGSLWEAVRSLRSGFIHFESTCENFHVLEASQSRNVAEHGFRALSCHLRCGRIGRVEDDVGTALVRASEHWLLGALYDFGRAGLQFVRYAMYASLDRWCGATSDRFLRMMVCHA